MRCQESGSCKYLMMSLLLSFKKSGFGVRYSRLCASEFGCSGRRVVVCCSEKRAKISV